MQITYKRNGLKNYMVVKNERDEPAGLREKMIIRNKIPYLARMTPQIIDGKSYYHYDIQGRVSLEALFTGRSMTRYEVSTILQAIASLLSELERYLLSPDEVVFSPSDIWLAPDNLEAIFAYVPGMVKDESYGIQRLAEYLTEHVDGDDREAAAMAYRYLEMVENGYIKPVNHQGQHGIGEADMMGNEFSIKDRVPEILPEENWNIGEEINEAMGSYFEDDNVKKGRINKKKLSYLCLGATILVSAVYIAFVIDPSLLPIMLTDEEYIMVGVGIAIVFALVLMGVMYANRKATSEAKMGEDDEKLTYEEIKDGQDEIEYQEFGGQESKAEYGNNQYQGDYDDDKTVLLSHRRLQKEESRFPVLSYSDGRKIIINHFPFVMGKMESRVDEVIEGEGISRIHAMLKDQDGRYFISDLNSLNGTGVNGKLLEANETVEITDGDTVFLAETALKFKVSKAS